MARPARSIEERRAEIIDAQDHLSEEEKKKQKEEEERKRREREAAEKAEKERQGRQIAEDLARKAAEGVNPLERGAQRNLWDFAQKRKEEEEKKQREQIAANIAKNAAENANPLEKAAKQNLIEAAKIERERKAEEARKKREEAVAAAEKLVPKNNGKQGLSDQIYDKISKERDGEEEAVKKKYIPGTKQALSDSIFQKYLEAEKYYNSEEVGDDFWKAVLNRFRSVPGETVEDFAFLLSDYLPGYKPAQDVIEKNTAGQIGETADRQFAAAKEKTGDTGDFMIDTADALTRMLSNAAFFGKGNIALSQGIGSGLEEYRQQREEEGTGKLEALLRGGSTGAAGYFIERLGGIGGVKDDIIKAAVPGSKILDSGKTLSLLASIGKNALEEGGEEFAEAIVNGITDMIADMAFRGEVSVDFNLLETIRGAGIGALIGGGFGAVNYGANSAAGIPVPFDGKAVPGSEAEMVAAKIEEIENRPISEAEKAAKMEKVKAAAEAFGKEQGLAEEAQKFEEIHKARAAEIDRAVEVGRKLGVSVSFDENIAGNGIHTSDGRIFINPNTENPVMQVLVHELTHDIETSGLYENFSGKILDYAKNVQGVDLKQMERAVIEDYRKAGQELTPELADREIVAKFAETYLFTDQKAIDRLCDTDPSLFRRIKYWIEDAIAKFRGTEQERFLVDAQRLYEKALATRGERSGAGVEQHAYDYSKPFEQQIDDMKSGKFPQYNSLIIGPTPKVFRDIGLNPLPMTFAVNHAKDILSGNVIDHDFGESILKQLPQNINSPVAIIESKTNSGTSLVALLDVMHQGKHIITAVNIDGFGTVNGIRIDSNVITSEHKRQNAVTGLLKDALIDESQGKIGVYYIDKNKATSFLNASGVQFPGGISITDGFNHSIRENGSTVKPKLNNVTESLQFKRWFGDWQKNPKNASKIVDNNGEPLVVYHGTDADFTVFDRTKSRANMDIQGNFFSPWEDDARGYGGKVGAYYLNIKNPADETTAYKALRKFQGQNEAGKKARDYLINLGYDGVNNNDEEYIAFYPEQIKSATDNIGTFDPQNPDIRYSTGRSFDEIAAESKTPSMERANKNLNAQDWKNLAEGIAPEFPAIWRMKDFARALDSAAGGNKVLRQQLFELYEKPLNEAQGNYARNYAEKAKSISEKFKELGIKADSKESAAVQRIGEGVKEIDKKGNTVPYTLNDLKTDFPDSWENIKAGADYCRKIYDEFLQDLNKMYSEIYPATVEEANARVSGYNDRIKNDAEYIDRYNEVIGKLEEQKTAKQTELSRKRPNSLIYAELQNQIANIDRRIEIANRRIERIENRKLTKEISRDTLQAQIENGEILKNKQIKPRKDYFRHFQELTDEFAEIADIFSNDQRIPPNLAGKSENTKPRTIWTSIAQSRSNNNYYTEDAVGGLLRYTEIAEKLLVFDPLISHFRDVNSAIRAAGVMADNEVKGKGTNAGQFASWADDITNQLAGKTNAVDRLISDKTGALGRATMKAVEALNRRVKSNAILGNFRSALVQIGNLPNAALYIQNPVDWTMGAISLTNSMPEIIEARSKSNFMNRRYMGDTIDALTKEIQQNKLLDKPKEFALWMLGAGDKAAAELIWHTAYSQAVRNPKVLSSGKGLRGYENAVDYADDITRRSIGGRAEGDIPYWEESKIVGLIAPFQIEVANTFNAFTEQIGKKNAAGIIGFEIGVWLINTVLEGIIGDRPLGLDYIDAIWDIIAEAIGDDEEEEKDFWDIVTYAGGRIAGETLSGMPLGAQIGDLITGGDEQKAEDWFGDSDPTRYGTGNIGMGAFADAADYFISGETPEDFYNLITDGKKNSYAEWAEPVLDTVDTFAPLFMKWGGKQTSRTLRGIDQLIQGGAYGESDEGRYLKFPQEYDPESVIKTFLFGQYASDRGQEYIDSGFSKKLSEKQTEQMEIAEPYGISNEEFYDIVLGLKPYDKKAEKQQALFENEDLDNWEKSVMDYILFGNPTKGMDAVVPEREYSDEEAFYRSGLDESGKRLFDAGYSREVIETVEKVTTKSDRKADDIKNIQKALDCSEAEAFEILQKQEGKWFDWENIPEEDAVRAQGAFDYYGMNKDEYLKVLNYSKYGVEIEKEDGTMDYSTAMKDVVPNLARVLNVTEERAEELFIRVNSFDYSREDLEDEQIEKLQTAQDWYEVEDKGYFVAKNAILVAEGEKDKYGNTIEGSTKAEAIENIMAQLGVDKEEATIYYLAASGDLILSVEDLSSSHREDLETAMSLGWTEEQYIAAVNIIKVAGVSKKDDILKALTDAGAPYEMAQGYYNLRENKDYDRYVGTISVPYGMSTKKQADKIDYFIANYNADGKIKAEDLAKWVKATKGMRKKADWIAALIGAGAPRELAEIIYKLMTGKDKKFNNWYKENGG